MAISDTLIERYRERFNEELPLGAMWGMTEAEIEARIRRALKDDEPIREGLIDGLNT